MILGTSKAGTTSLHSYLDQHPDVAMCDPKEPFYFRAEYERGIEYYWQTYFRDYRDHKIAGDAAPQHLYLPFCAHRIAEALHDPYLIILCRNPTERAISAYWHNARRGLEPRSFDEAIELNLKRLEEGPLFHDEADAKLYAEHRLQPGPAIHRKWQFYLDPGYYATHVERYRELFGENRLVLLFFDDLIRDPCDTVKKVHTFIGLESLPLRDAEQLNQATSPTAAATVDALGRMPGKGVIPRNWRRIIKNKIFAMGGKQKPVIASNTRRMLVDHYRPHNKRLEEITGRDLSSWNISFEPDEQELDRDVG